MSNYLSVYSGSMIDEVIGLFADKGLENVNGLIQRNADGTFSVKSIDLATDATAGLIKTNSSESITLNAEGQLDVGGRLGQMSSTTGIYSPKSISPAQVKNGSFLLTEASGTKLGSKSLAVSTGTGINLKTTAQPGATQYVVANTYENRIICAGAVGATVALNESSAAENYVNVTSVQIGGSSFVPNSSADDSSNNIIITTDESINPDSSISQIRVYFDEGEAGGFSNLFVGQAVGGAGGASVIVGQKNYSASGNACAIIGASIYNSGNGNALFGRQHISRKNRSMLVGTGHDTTNARAEGVAAFGLWSDLSSETLFAVGNGTSQTVRSNAFEVGSTGIKAMNMASGKTSGIQTSANSTKTINITFGKTFPAIPNVVVGFDSNSNDGAFGKCCCSVTSITTTGCTIKVFNGDTATRTPVCQWIAVSSL